MNDQLDLKYSKADASIQLVINELITEAKILRMNYLNLWKMENNQRIIKGKYIPRLIEKSGTVYIDWISYNKRNRSVNVPFDKRQKIHGDYVKKSKSGGYNKTSFKYASEWEYSLIMQFEGEFQKIRGALEALKKSLFYIKTSKNRIIPETN